MKTKQDRLLELYVKGLISYEELVKRLADLDKLPEPPVIY